MVKKLEKLSADYKAGAELPLAVNDSAQRIWLAGLGAFAKAQEEGGKVFEALVKEGLSLQRKSQEQTQERMQQAADRMTTLAAGLSGRANEQWDKLENIFEQRVAKALPRLGVPSAREVERLSQRVAELTEQVRRLAPPPADEPARPATSASAKSTARKAKTAASPRVG